MLSINKVMAKCQKLHMLTTKADLNFNLRTSQQLPSPQHLLILGLRKQLVQELITHIFRHGSLN